FAWGSFIKAVVVFAGILGSVPANMLEPHAKYSMTAIWLARATGFFSLLLLVGFIVLWWRKREKRQYLLPIIGIALFVCGAALAIAFSRYTTAKTWYMEWGLTPRFSNLVALFWASLFCGLLALASEWNSSRSQRMGTGIAALALLLALLPSQLHMFMSSGQSRQGVEKATMALVNG